jgi:thioredoxin 1
MTHLSSRAIFLILSIIVLVHGHSPKGRSHVLVSGLTFVGNTFTSSLHRQQRSQSLTRADYHSKLMHSSSPSRPSSSTVLNMVNTKSGGRPIVSEEQFRIEVLGLSPSTSKTQQQEDDSGKNAFKPCTKPILVFYSAPWCGPCRLSNPVVKAIISQFVPKIDVVEVCTDDLPEIAEEMGVVSIPTIKIYHKGELMDTIVGCVAKNVLGNAVNKVLDDLGLQDDSPSGDTDDDEEDDDDDDDDDDSVEDD